MRELGEHLSTEDLERYCIGQMRDPQLGQAEEHLLWCLECIDRAEAIDRFLRMLERGVVRGGLDVDLWPRE